MSLTLGATSVEVQLGTSQDSNDPKTDVHGPGGVPQDPTQQQQVMNINSTFVYTYWIL